MICEIINPSDAYTLECNDFLVGAVAVAVLGEGHYGLKSEDGERQTPVLLGWVRWLEEEGIKDLAEYLKQNNDAIAEALGSVRIGEAAERKAEREAVKYMTAENAEKYRLERHDAARSSMNNIGRRAWQIAQRMRGDKDAEVPPDDSIVLVGG